MQRAHVYLSWDQLVGALGLQGRPIKVYSEQDNDYLHIFLDPPTDAEVGEEEGFIEVHPGGYVEARSLRQVVKDPDIRRRVGDVP